VEGAERARWQAIHDAQLVRWGRMQGLLEQVATAFAAEDIDLIGLKNVSIARGIFPCPGCVPMGDLDVLVDTARFRDAHRLLMGLGFQLDSTDPSNEAPTIDTGADHGGTEYIRRVDGQDILFELQWRPVSGRWLNRDQEPDGAELVRRSIPMKGSAARMLEPSDNMLQVALHTAKHTYCRAPGLRLHTDVDRLARFAPPDWEAVTAAARRLETTVAVYFSLAIAVQLLDAPVPMRVLDALRPPAWQVDAVSRFLGRADIFEPLQSKFSMPEIVAFYMLLHDSPRRLAATVLDAQASDLRVSRLPHLMKSGLGRAGYLLFKRQYRD